MKSVIDGDECVLIIGSTTSMTMIASLGFFTWLGLAAGRF